MLFINILLDLLKFYCLTHADEFKIHYNIITELSDFHRLTKRFKHLMALLYK